jgi:hypothetical protein
MTVLGLSLYLSEVNQVGARGMIVLVRMLS